MSLQIHSEVEVVVVKDLGRFEAPITYTVTGTPSPPTITDIDFNYDGTLFALDLLLRKVNVIDFSGGLPEIDETKTVNLNDDVNRSPFGVTKDLGGFAVWVGDLERKALYKYDSVSYDYALLAGSTIDLTATTNNLRPEGLVLGPDNIFYVADLRRDYVYAFLPNGGRSNSREFNLKRPENSQPSGMSIDSKGNFWVVDRDAMVYSYDSSGNYRRNASFRCIHWNPNPEGIYVDQDDDTIWVLDRNKKIYRYTPEGRIVISGVIDLNDATEGVLYGLSKNSTGSLFVVGQSTNKIYELRVDPLIYRPPSSSTTLTTTLSADQTSSDVIVTPQMAGELGGIAIDDDGNFLMIDSFINERRVHVYNSSGRYLRKHLLTHPEQFIVLQDIFSPGTMEEYEGLDPRFSGVFTGVDSGIVYDSTRDVYWVLGQIRIFKYDSNFVLQSELESINLSIPDTVSAVLSSKNRSYQENANDNANGLAISSDGQYLWTTNTGRGARRRGREGLRNDPSALYRYKISDGTWRKYNLAVGLNKSSVLGPSGLFIDGQGYIWVLDTLNSTILRYREQTTTISDTEGTLKFIDGILIPQSFAKKGLSLDSGGHIWFGNEASSSLSNLDDFLTPGSFQRSSFSIRKLLVARPVIQERIFVEAQPFRQLNILDTTIRDGVFYVMGRGPRNNPADGRFPWGLGYTVTVRRFGSSRPDGSRGFPTRLRVDLDPGYNTNIEISDPRLPFESPSRNPFEKFWQWVKDKVPFRNRSSRFGRTKTYSVNFGRPRAFDVDSDGNIWIAGVANGYILEEWGIRAPEFYWRMGYIRRFTSQGEEADVSITTTFTGYHRPAGTTADGRSQRAYTTGPYDLVGLTIDNDGYFWVCDGTQNIIAKYELESDSSLKRINDATINIREEAHQARSMALNADGNLMVLYGGLAPFYIHTGRTQQEITDIRGLDRPANIKTYSTKSLSILENATISLPKAIRHKSGDIEDIEAVPRTLAVNRSNSDIFIGYRAGLQSAKLGDEDATSSTYLRVNLQAGNTYETTTLSTDIQSMLPEPPPTQARLLREIPFEKPGALRASGLTADNFGSLWLLDPEADEIRRYGPRRDTFISRSISLAVENSHPRGLSSDDAGQLYVSDGDKKQVFVYDPFDLNDDGEALTSVIDLNQELINPSKIAVAPNGHFFIESEGHRVTHYNHFGDRETFRDIDMVSLRGLADNVTAMAVDEKFDLWILTRNEDGTYFLSNQYKLIANNPLPPRFLKFGFINTEENVYETEDETLFERFREYEGPPIINLYSVHLVSFNNILGEDRPQFYNALKSPPVVSETLSSLTTSMSSFNNVSVTLSDPNVRGYFDGGFGFSATQNPVRIYRIVCGKRIQVWNGYVDGYTVNRGHEIGLNMRSIMKKFDQMATFGFTKIALQRWGFNQNRIPIVAARVIPWTPVESEHSPVGCATFSFRGQDVSQNSAVVNFRTPLGVPGQSAPPIYSVNGYEDRLLRYAYEPIFSGDPNPSKTFEDGEPSPDQEKRNERLREHLETTKKPTYVSFDIGTLPRSKIEIAPNGEMTFDRGIFFAPVDNPDEAKIYFKPNRDNYRPSLIPSDAIAGNWRAGTQSLWAPHAEKFFVGQRDIALGTSSPLRNQKLSAFFELARTKIGEMRSGSTTFKDRDEAIGFDLQSLFPATNLGESYCNWTSIPVSVEGGRDLSAWDGYQFPPRDGEALGRPQIQYQSVPGTPDADGYYDGILFSSQDVHPLDSFYRSTLSALGELRPSGLYFRGVMYTPHQLSLCFYSVKEEKLFVSGDESFLATRFFEPQFYFYTQFTTFTVYDSNGLSDSSASRIENQAEEFQRHYSKSRQISSGSRRGLYAWWELPRTSNLTTGGYLSGGTFEQPMARSKDMYVTLQAFQRNHKIKAGLLDVKHPTSTQLSSMILSDFVPNVDYKSSAAKNLRVMPAYPHGLTEDGELPNISCKGENGAFMVTARYAKLNEVGYWDTSTELNDSASENVEDNFAAYYHHDQYEENYNFNDISSNKGVSPYSFLYAVIKAMKLEPDWDHDTRDFTEMTNWNPMQLISESSQSYKSLVDRMLPAMGKFLRWNPRTSKVEVKTWLTAHEDPFNPGTIDSPGQNVRVIEAAFDEDCLTFSSIQNTAASTPSSFIFENPDMLRGTQTMHEFSDAQRLLARYVRLRSTVFIQGKIVNLKTGTWCTSPSLGLAMYDSIADILSNRTEIVEFTVPSEVLLGQGFGHVGVGSWVRLLTPAFTGGAADVFIKEATSSELETRFRALRFPGVGIQKAEDNIMASASVPASEDDIEGDDGPTDDVRPLSPGDNNLRRLYY